MVDLTTKSVSVRASTYTVDHSRNTIGAESHNFVVSVLLIVLSMSEKVQYGMVSYFSCSGN